MHDLPAAAIPKNSVVARADGSQVTISRVENSTPREGLITWTDKATGNRFAVPASRRVPAVSLPPIG